MIHLLLFCHLDATLFGINADEAEIISAVATVVATGIALFTVWQTKISIKSVEKQANATAIMTCVSAYIDIRAIKDAAELETHKDKKVHLAKTYYREFCDQFWVEYRVWLKGAVDDQEMSEWARMRHRMCQKPHDEIKIDDKTNIIYKEEWAELISHKKHPPYFEPGTFVYFVEKVHKGEISTEEGFKRCRKDINNKVDIKNTIYN